MDKQAVMGALDRAVTETAWEEYIEITKTQTDLEKSTLRDRARREIFKLRGLDLPRYNEKLVSPFYLAAYQLQHINLTYSLIKDTLRSKDPNGSLLTTGGELQVVDFGAGALAMQFGVMLAVAESLETGQNVKAVHVDSVDTSEEMLSVGIAMWEKLCHIAKTDRTGRLDTVHRACQIIDFQPHTKISTIKAREGCVSWLSAIHAIYQDYEDDIRRNLAEIYQHILPEAGFITCYGNHDTVSIAGDRLPDGNINIARNVSPFPSGQFCRRLLAGHSSKGGPSAGQALAGELSGLLAPNTTSRNRNWGLIDSEETLRTERSILNWTYDTAFFAFARADTVGSCDSFATYPVILSGPFSSYHAGLDDIDDLPF